MAVKPWLDDVGRGWKSFFFSLRFSNIQTMMKNGLRSFLQIDCCLYEKGFPLSVVNLNQRSWKIKCRTALCYCKLC